MSKSRTADVVVIGGGIAGVSVGYFLAEIGVSVTLCEAEPTLAHHTTGRSAAQYLENYGSDTVRRLTIAGRPFFAEPNEQFCDGPLWASRPMMRVGGTDMVEEFEAEVAEAGRLVPSTRLIDADTAVRHFPPLRHSMVAAAVFEPDAMELDVARLHQLFVRGLRHHGGTIHTSTPVTAIAHTINGWTVSIGDDSIECGIVVNAAGAWGGRVAAMAEVDQIGLHPLRRTALIARIPDELDTSGWPLTAFARADDSMEAYCKPESGGLLISPADETPSIPCDAKPDELNVALAIDRINSWTTLDIRSVSSTWAGLRTFTADRSLVAGFAPDAPGFFWLVGQGGFGIQTSPGLGRAAAAILTSGRIPDDIYELGVSADDLSAVRPSLMGELITGH